MAQRECTGTIQASFSLQATATLSAYIWCSTNSIQAYLDTESTIVLGDNYGLATAKVLENDAVKSIVSYLSPVFTLSVSSVSDELIRIASQITASQIAAGRMGASLGSDLAEWITRMKNEAWASLQRAFISQTLSGTGITTKTVPLWKRLLFSKSRERAIVPNV